MCPVGIRSSFRVAFRWTAKGKRCITQEQVTLTPNEGEAPISVADFAVPEKRLAIYIDGAAFHVGERIRRDRWIRERLRNMEPPWTVVELRAGDLNRIDLRIRNWME